MAYHQLPPDLYRVAQSAYHDGSPPLFPAYEYNMGPNNTSQALSHVISTVNWEEYINWSASPESALTLSTEYRDDAFSMALSTTIGQPGWYDQLAWEQRGEFNTPDAAEADPSSLEFQLGLQTETVFSPTSNGVAVDGVPEDVGSSASVPQIQKIPGPDELFTKEVIKEAEYHLCRYVPPYDPTANPCGKAVKVEGSRISKWKRHISTVHGRDEVIAINDRRLDPVNAIALKSKDCESNTITCNELRCGYRKEHGFAWKQECWERVETAINRHVREFHHFPPEEAEQEDASGSPSLPSKEGQFVWFSSPSPGSENNKKRAGKRKKRAKVDARLPAGTYAPLEGFTFPQQPPLPSHPGSSLLLSAAPAYPQLDDSPPLGKRAKRY